MSLASRFEEICRCMSDPGFYPHPVSRLERKETHISVVFLTGDWVYKLKKPKNLGFLDFRELSARHYYCRQEIKLNQRLSFGVYHEVVEIHDDGTGSLSLGAGGEVVEYAVKMAQLPADASLDALMSQGMVTDGQIQKLGEILAAFYDKADRGPQIDAFGDPGHVRFNMEENFTQIGPFAPGLLDSEKWEFICQLCRSFLDGHEDLFLRRKEEGRIRDGHGDLRAEHIYFHDGIQIIDCIEFNERFRYGDAALDLAFLMMDLDRLGHPEIGRRLLQVYAALARDPEVYALMDFYAAYRALVRLKVACFSLEHAPLKDPVRVEIRRYLNQAYRYVLSFGRPVLWVFSGLPASGKSTLACRFAKALFMPLFGSDAVRRQAEGGDGVVAFGTGAYQPLMRNRVYAKLFNLAQEELGKGRSVVLDATFSKEEWRESAMRLARDRKAGLVFVHCVCPPQTIRDRLALREGGESDARLIHFEDMIRSFMPFVSMPADSYLSVDTQRPPDESFYDLLAQGYALKHAQVRGLSAELDCLEPAR